MQTTNGNLHGVPAAQRPLLRQCAAATAVAGWYTTSTILDQAIQGRRLDPTARVALRQALPLLADLLAALKLYVRLSLLCVVVVVVDMLAVYGNMPAVMHCFDLF